MCMVNMHAWSWTERNPTPSWVPDVSHPYTVCLHFPALCPQHTLAWCYNDQENEVHIVCQQVVIDLGFQQAYKLCIILRDLTQTKLVLWASLCMWPGFTFKDVGIDCSKIYKEIKQSVPPLPRLSGAGVHFLQMVIEIFTSHVFILELDWLWTL